MFKKLSIFITCILLFTASDFYACQSTIQKWTLIVQNEFGAIVHEEQLPSYDQVGNKQQTDYYCMDDLNCPILALGCMYACYTCPGTIIGVTGCVAATAACGECCSRYRLAEQKTLKSME